MYISNNMHVNHMYMNINKYITYYMHVYTLKDIEISTINYKICRLNSHLLLMMMKR